MREPSVRHAPRRGDAAGVVEGRPSACASNGRGACPGAGVEPGDGGPSPATGTSVTLAMPPMLIALSAGRPEHLRVEGGTKAPSSGRDVAATEVRDDVDSGELREERRVVELNRSPAAGGGGSSDRAP